MEPVHTNFQPEENLEEKMMIRLLCSKPSGDSKEKNRLP